MPFLDEIAAHLAANGAGTVSSDILLGSKALIPSGDGPYISLRESGGTGSLKTHNGTAATRPSAQVLCRAKSYAVARARLKLAYDALGGGEGLYNVTLSGTFYQSVVAAQEPTDLGLDTSSRIMIAFNIDVVKAPS